MKKNIVISVVCVMVTTSVNAGWFSNLFNKTSEPTTLAQACNTDEITTICPEILLGQKTMQECLMENVSKLSDKCAKFVKNSIKTKVDKVKSNLTTGHAAINEAGTAKQAEINAKIQNVKNSAQGVKAGVKQVSDSVKQTGQALKPLL